MKVKILINSNIKKVDSIAFKELRERATITTNTTNTRLPYQRNLRLRWVGVVI